MSEIAKTLTPVAERAARKAEAAISATQRAANGALDSLHEGVENLRDEAPGALSRAAAQADELTRRGLERAREVAADLRDKAERTGANTVGYIRDEPVKSVLIAAAAGATLAAVVSLLARNRRNAG